MKKIIFPLFFLTGIFLSAKSQVTVYSENFNAGFGGWTNTDLSSPWGNITDGFGLTNIWQVSDDESGMVPPACGAGGQGNPSLYMGADALSTGAAYSSTATTNRRIASPNINTTGYTNLTLGFNFIGNGFDVRDKAYFQYSIDGGTSWISPAGAPTTSNPAMGTGGSMNNMKSQLCGGGQGMWTNITWTMPATCENITNLKIAFVWQNNDAGSPAGSAVDPSFAVDNITITTPSSVLPPVADFSASDTDICAGQCINFTDLSTNTPTGWTWTFNGGTPASSNIQNPTNICFNTPGSYTIELLASNSGGSDTETKTAYITVHPNPSINLGPDTTICSGYSLTLDAGAGYSSYVWTPSGSTQTINVTTGGTYSVVVTDANTCTGTDAINVSVTTQADATITTADIYYCSNESPVNLTATDPGGTWSGMGITNPSSGTFNPNVAGAGTHTITYGISGACGDTATINLTVYTAPVVDLGPDTTICSGYSLTLDAGAGYSSYVWTPSGSTQTINVTTGGTYSVVVTDANTCTGTDAINVSVTNQADATITTADIYYCSNESPVNLTATDPGGTWSGTGITNPTTGQFNPSVPPAGTYTITYGISGACGDTATIDLTIYTAPVVDLGPDTTICLGYSLTLDAGAGYSSYVWTPSGSTQTINVTTGGTYSVVVTDANTCTGTDAINVSVTGQYDATITTTDLSYCSNESPVNLTATDPGGTWSGTGITNPTTGQFSPSVPPAGTYTITYGISGACGDTATIDLTIFTAPNVNLGPDTSICTGEMLVLDAGAGYSSYVWTPSGGTQTINVTAGGTYSVVVTDANTCQGSDAVVVNVLSQADATILTQGPFCSNISPFLLQAQTAGGTWTGTGVTNATSGMFNPGIAGTGTYTITYTISGACGDTDTQDITIWDSPVNTIFHENESCINASDGYAWIYITGGTPPYSINWISGSDNDTIVDLSPGNYTVTVTDDNGCSTFGNIEILAGTEECSPPHVYIPNVFSPNGDGQNDMLFVRGEGIRFMSFIIYDRWGEKIFETTDQTIGWDGTFKNIRCMPGVYTYYLKVTYTNLNEEKFSGTITLVW